MKRLVVLIPLLAGGCVTDRVTFSCVRGVVFVHSINGGISWLPDVNGRPVSCVEFGMSEEIPVPEGDGK